MHLKRWLTSLVALPILLYVLLKGSYFKLYAAAGPGEQCRPLGIPHHLRPGSDAFREDLSLTLGLLLLLSFSTARPYLPGFFLVFGMLGYFLYYLLQYELFPQLLPELALSCLGLLYVPYLLGHFLWLRQLPQGTILAALVAFSNFCRRHRRVLFRALVWRKETLPTSQSRQNAGWFVGRSGRQLSRWCRLRPLAAPRRRRCYFDLSGFAGCSNRAIRRSVRIDVKTSSPGKRCFQHFTRSWRAAGSIG